MSKLLICLSNLSDLGLVIIGAFSLYWARRTYKLDEQNTFSKLSITPVQKKVKYSLINEDREVKFRNSFQEAKENEGSQEGFPTISLNQKHNYSKHWIIKIRNVGDHASTNIKINYSVFVKKMNILYGIDEIDVLDYKPIDFHVFSNEIEIPYMGGNQIKDFPILMFDGEFPEADLIINSLKSDQAEFITEPIKVDTIKHPDFDCLEDSPHRRRMLGIQE